MFLHLTNFNRTLFSWRKKFWKKNYKNSSKDEKTASIFHSDFFQILLRRCRKYKAWLFIQSEMGQTCAQQSNLSCCLHLAHVLTGKLPEIQYWSVQSNLYQRFNKFPLQGKLKTETRRCGKTVRKSVSGRKGSRFTCLAEDLVKTWTGAEVIQAWSFVSSAQAITLRGSLLTGVIEELVSFSSFLVTV